MIWIAYSTTLDQIPKLHVSMKSSSLFMVDISGHSSSLPIVQSSTGQMIVARGPEAATITQDIRQSNLSISVGKWLFQAVA